MKNIEIDMCITQLSVPCDANFIAMDWDGRWHWFMHRPYLGLGSPIWMPSKKEEDAFDDDDRCICKSKVLSKHEWKDSLIEL
jgi:hypothetical protein